MSESKPSSNAKIYDRPERKGPSPLMIAVALIVVLLIGLLAFKLIHHSAAPSAHVGGTASSKIFTSPATHRFTTKNYFAAAG